MKRLGSALLLTFALCGAGCMFAPAPPQHFYTLSSAACPADGSSPLSIGILLTEFPAALDRPQIMLRTNENRMDIQELHRWAGPLNQQLLHVLTENLVRLTGSQRIAPPPWDKGFVPDRKLSVAVLRFDGVPGGTALLRARWSLTDADGKLLQMRTSTLEEAAGDSIEALVTAQSLLVALLAEEIAEELQSIP